MNVGITVATDAGTLVPTIFDADAKEVGEIAAEARDLEAAARAGSLAAPQLAGGTFTFTDLGDFAVSRYLPVIHGGQAAALAVAGVADDARARLTIACDNRMVDATAAAGYLGRVRELAETGLAVPG